jgi:hypothetical protein
MILIHVCPILPLRTWIGYNIYNDVIKDWLPDIEGRRQLIAIASCVLGFVQPQHHHRTSAKVKKQTPRYTW